MTAESSKSMRRFLLSHASIVCLAIAAHLSVGSSSRGDLPWEVMPYTSFQEMQAVNASGSSTWTMPMWGEGQQQGYKLRGVVLNNPGDMLDSTSNYVACAAGTQWNMGGQWQIFIQSDNPSDVGGAALWMAQNYGNVTWHWPDSSYSYTNAEWEAEIRRLSLNGTLRAGDVIEVRARGGLFHGGKFNVNEQHDNDPAFDFDISLISHGSLPEPTVIDLSDVKDSVGNFIFDPTRESGGELYQSTLVCLKNVSLVNPDSANWKANSTVQITDGTQTLDMVLGLNGFGPETLPTGPFDVVGIFDQESSTNRDGYYLWVTDASQFVSTPEPGTMALLAAMALCVGATRLRRGQPNS